MKQDMSSFGLFNKQKNQDQSGQSTDNLSIFPFSQAGDAQQEAQVEEKMSKETLSILHSNQTTIMSASPKIADESSGSETFQEDVCKTYLKAIPLRDLSDIVDIKSEIQNGNILILRITPLASKSVESVKSAVNELYAFAESIGGDIARLGEERVVLCPKNVKIWREKMPEKIEPISTTEV